MTGIWRLLTSETLLYLLKRSFQALLTLLFASALCFAIIQLTPGDYLDTLRQNPQISPERLDELARQFGLEGKPDSPIVNFSLKGLWDWLVWLVPAYKQWLWQILKFVPYKLTDWLIIYSPQFNFGESFAYFRPVSALLIERIPATLLLAIASILCTWTVALPLGIVSAINQNLAADRILRVLSYLGQGFPSFIAALLLLFFAQVTSPLFPVGDMTSFNYTDLSPLGKALDIGWHMILPTIALTITGFAGLQRITRGELLDVLRQDYIQTARAKGLPENRVIYVHALRNAVNPLITLLGFEFANLLGGAFITEFFFNWPGLGRLILQAVQAQDIYLVMASLMMGATMLIIGNFLADLLLKTIDPRIRLANLK